MSQLVYNPFNRTYKSFDFCRCVWYGTIPTSTSTIPFMMGVSEAAPYCTLSPSANEPPILECRRFLDKQGDASLWLRYRDEDYAILEVSRGMGPCGIQEWFQKHDNYTKVWPDANIRKAVKILNPHYRAYLQGLVLVGRNPPQRPNKTKEEDKATAAAPCRPQRNEVVSYTMTIHAIIRGRPQDEDIAMLLQEKHIHLEVVRCVRSNTAGHLSWVSLTHTTSPITQSKFFRLHMEEAGFPILGKAQGSRSFRGQRLLMAAMRLSVTWQTGDDDASSVDTQRTAVVENEPPTLFDTLLDKEERFWQQRQHASSGMTGTEDTASTTTAQDYEPTLPRAYQEGSVIFGGLTFLVTRDVMIPRPASLTLVECAAALWDTLYAKSDIRPVVLDLGTGSGCLLVSMLYKLLAKGARGYGVDASAEALAVAQTNAMRILHANSENADCQFIHARFDEVTIGPEQANIVICNPPYHVAGRLIEAASLEYEPRQALFVDEGCDGLSAYRQAWSAVQRCAAPGAIVVLEVCQFNVMAVYEYLRETKELQQISFARDAKQCIRSIQGIFSPEGAESSYAL